MSRHSSAATLATPRNGCAENFQPELRAETSGNSVSLSCLNDAIDASGTPDKVLAERLGVSRGEFSKLRAGRFRIEQIDKLPPEIVADYRRRVNQRESGSTAEEVVLARLAHAVIDALPFVRGRARMAKCELPEESR